MFTQLNLQLCTKVCLRQNVKQYYKIIVVFRILSPIQYIVLHKREVASILIITKMYAFY